MNSFKIILLGLMLYVCTSSNVLAVNPSIIEAIPCDTITLRNEDVVIGQIIEETKGAIVYIPCNGKAITKRKPFPKISKINYANGNVWDVENDPKVKRTRAVNGILIFLFIVTGLFVVIVTIALFLFLFSFPFL